MTCATSYLEKGKTRIVLLDELAMFCIELGVMILHVCLSVADLEI